MEFLSTSYDGWLDHLNEMFERDEDAYADWLHQEWERTQEVVSWWAI